MTKAFIVRWLVVCVRVSLYCFNEADLLECVSVHIEYIVQRYPQR